MRIGIENTGFEILALGKADETRDFVSRLSFLGTGNERKLVSVGESGVRVVESGTLFDKVFSLECPTKAQSLFVVMNLGGPHLVVSCIGGTSVLVAIDGKLVECDHVKGISLSDSSVFVGDYAGSVIQVTKTWAAVDGQMYRPRNSTRKISSVVLSGEFAVLGLGEGDLRGKGNLVFLSRNMSESFSKDFDFEVISLSKGDQKGCIVVGLSNQTLLVLNEQHDVISRIVIEGAPIKSIGGGVVSTSDGCIVWPFDQQQYWEIVALNEPLVISSISADCVIASSPSANFCINMVTHTISRIQLMNNVVCVVQYLHFLVAVNVFGEIGFFTNYGAIFEKNAFSTKRLLDVNISFSNVKGPNVEFTGGLFCVCSDFTSYVINNEGVLTSPVKNMASCAVSTINAHCLLLYTTEGLLRLVDASSNWREIWSIPIPDVHAILQVENFMLLATQNALELYTFSHNEIPHLVDTLAVDVSCIGLLSNVASCVYVITQTGVGTIAIANGLVWTSLVPANVRQQDITCYSLMNRDLVVVGTADGEIELYRVFPSRQMPCMSVTTVVCRHKVCAKRIDSLIHCGDDRDLVYYSCDGEMGLLSPSQVSNWYW